MTREISGLSEIEDAFSAVIVDQYGVLHDGQMPVPGALEALTRLNANNIPIVALTNSGKRAKTNADRLQRIGFPGGLFTAVVSSGDIARDQLKKLPSGSSILLIAREGETELLEGLDLIRAKHGEKADMIVFAAVEPARRSRTDYAEDLLPYARNKTPALLVNPDHLAAENGTIVFGPGAVAEDYARSGGPVETLGKPARKMFDVALAALGNPSSDRVLMIGDSPHHDIGGAIEAGLQTLLIRDGIQSDLEGINADFSMHRLSW